MTKVSVATLKAELSRYLDLVRNGEDVVITSHSEEIAKLIPFHPVTPPEVDWSEFLKANPPVRTKKKAKTGAEKLIRQLRDEE